jgi:hypothetical protein
MSNLTVSSAVDEFMQAGNQAEMVSALGTLPGPALPLTGDGPFIEPTDLGAPIVNNPNGDTVLEVDGFANVSLNGYNTDVGLQSVIGFDLSGVATVYSASDSQQLPIRRTVGNGVLDLNNDGFGYTIGPLNYVTAQVAITGAAPGDAVAVNFDAVFPAWYNAGPITSGYPVPGQTVGGIIVGSVWIDDSGNVNVQLINADPENNCNIGQSFPQTMYVEVSR